MNSVTDTYKQKRRTEQFERNKLLLVAALKSLSLADGDEKQSDVGVSLETSGKTIENFQEFVARTVRENLIAKIGDLINEYVNDILVLNKLGNHLSERNADSVQTGQDVVAFSTHIASLIELSYVWKYCSKSVAA